MNGVYVFELTSETKEKGLFDTDRSSRDPLVRGP